ncbi:MAG: DUF1444 family protein [Pseudomonadota bacterium]
MNLRSRRHILQTAGLVPGAVLLARTTAQADDLDDGSFKREVVALLGGRHPEWTIAPTDDPAMIVISSRSISLTNLYLHVRSMPADRRETEIVAFVENALHVSMAGQLADDISYAAAETRLRPQIVPDDYKATASDIASRPFFAGLSIACVLDDGKAYQVLRQPTLATWHMDQTAVEARAIANLETVSASLALAAKPNSRRGAYVIVDTSDGYDAVRLLLPQFMSRLRDALGVPRAFVGIPNRDFLVAWTPDFAARQGFAAKIREDALSKPHRLTDMLFASSNAGVTPLTPIELKDHER